VCALLQELFYCAETGQWKTGRQTVLTELINFGVKQQYQHFVLWTLFQDNVKTNVAHHTR
jgi:hypothetical protein